MNIKHSLGFTLIELMIVVAIVAILAAFAYPSYQQHIVKTRRAEGKQALMELAQRFERCYTRFNKYTHSDCPKGPSGGGLLDVGSKYYSVAINAGDSTFTIFAAPQGVQANQDKECGAFQLDHTGKPSMKTYSGVKGTTEQCW